MILQDFFEYFTNKDRVINREIFNKTFEKRSLNYLFDSEIPLRGEKANFYKFLSQEESHTIMDADWNPKLDKLMLR